MMDGYRIEPLMKDAGFVDINCKKILIELGDWGSN